MDNCLFCKIAEKKIPSSIVYEDEDLLAFKDINPAAPVHLLVIPKKHFSSLSDCSANEAPLLGKMLALAPRLAEESGCARREAPPREVDHHPQFWRWGHGRGADVKV
ncbi:HIT domain-containing protein, partial [Duganella sp. Dugasp56]|uniref:HIT domain-containing protein n=1 Tax=Duganella sp. Dugasp56 TaxID=3243046 RepID=UPI0039B0DC42